MSSPQVLSVSPGRSKLRGTTSFEPLCVTCSLPGCFCPDLHSSTVMLLHLLFSKEIKLLYRLKFGCPSFPHKRAGLKLGHRAVTAPSSNQTIAAGSARVLRLSAPSWSLVTLVEAGNWPPTPLPSWAKGTCPCHFPARAWLSPFPFLANLCYWPPRGSSLIPLPSCSSFLLPPLRMLQDQGQGHFIRSPS